MRRLEFEQAIGRGAYGTVWKGTCRAGGAAFDVAIKAVDMNPSDMRRVKVESEIFLRLTHPNLVTCFGMLSTSDPASSVERTDDSSRSCVSEQGFPNSPSRSATPRSSSS